MTNWYTFDPPCDGVPKFTVEHGYGVFCEQLHKLYGLATGDHLIIPIDHLITFLKFMRMREKVGFGEYLDVLEFDGRVMADDLGWVMGDIDKKKQKIR